MVVKARLRIRHRGCFTEKVTGDAYVTQIVGDGFQGVTVVHGTTEREVDDILDGLADSTERLVVVERAPHTVVTRYHCRRDGTIATILAFGCNILWPAVYTGGHELFEVIGPSRERVSALVDRLRDLGDVYLEQLTDVAPDALDVNVSLSDLTTGLTARQLDVLRRAVDHGYYESPRGTSAEALARSFGVSRSTLQEHLRKAERHVLERFAGVLSTHPALSEAARRGRGRIRANRQVRKESPDTQSGSGRPRNGGKD